MGQVEGKAWTCSNQATNGKPALQSANISRLSSMQSPGFVWPHRQVGRQSSPLNPSGIPPQQLSRAFPTSLLQPSPTLTRPAVALAQVLQRKLKLFNCRPPSFSPSPNAPTFPLPLFLQSPWKNSCSFPWEWLTYPLGSRPHPVSSHP